MAPPWLRHRRSNSSLLLIYRPRRDERLSWPGWLTYSGQYTPISGHPSATGGAQDRESSTAKDRRSTTVPRHQSTRKTRRQLTKTVGDHGGRGDKAAPHCLDI